MATTSKPPGHHAIVLAAETYTYLPVASFHVNQALGPLELAGHLWRQLDQFLGDEGKARSVKGSAARLLPAKPLRALRVARLVTLYMLVRARHTLRASDEALELPIDGQFGLVRRSGMVKILDAEANTVYTYSPDKAALSKVRSRLSMTRLLSGHSFAPGLERVELEQGFLGEEFLEGHHPVNFAGCADDFRAVYAPLLRDLITARAPQDVELASYVSQLEATILDPKGLLWELPPTDQESVAIFTTAVTRELKAVQGKVTVPLVLSHGDFFSGNVVLSESGPKAIDWANAGFRSPLHDFYFLYFNHCQRGMDEAVLERWLAESRAVLRDQVRRTAPKAFQQLDPALSDANHFRWVFYLECIEVPLRRSLSPSDRYLRSMLERVAWFRSYEWGNLEISDEGAGRD